MRDERVAVIMGGPSSEHEISQLSGAQVVQALRGRFSVVVVEIGRDGVWSLDGETAPSLGIALDRLQAAADVVFPALHGAFGEDGTLQALLEVLGVPYVGSGIPASSLAMDKARTKQLWVAMGLPTPTFVHLGPRQRGEVSNRRLLERFPCVIKQTTSGSSVGVYMPATLEEAEAELQALLEGGHEVILEEIIRGRELTCAVLEGADGPRPLPVTEIRPAEAHAFFDYRSKYTDGEAEEITPAELPEDVSRSVQELAVRAHQVLGCRDLSRTDFMLEGGEPTLLETNTLPGLTANSLFPQAAAAAGMSFPSVVEHLVGQALARRASPTAG